MSWGALFRDGWQLADDDARQAARLAGGSPQAAAGQLGDAVSHALRLYQFACQDCWQAEHRQPAAPAAQAGLDAARALLEQAMHEIESGQVPADRAGQHVEAATQRARTLVRPAIDGAGPVAAADGATAPPAAGTPAGPDALHARARLLEQQLALALTEALAGLPPGPAGDGARRIAQAFDAVAALFVDGKPFDSPVAPLSKEK